MSGTESDVTADSDEAPGPSERRARKGGQPRLSTIEEASEPSETEEDGASSQDDVSPPLSGGLAVPPVLPANQAQGAPPQVNQAPPAAPGGQAQGNQAQGNQAQGNQAQGNQNQANPNPAAAAPAAQARPVHDTPQQNQNRRWTVWAQRVFCLPDTNGQNGIKASAVATCARIDETTLQPGGATALRNAGVGATDAAFTRFLAALDAYEQLPLPREKEQAAGLLREAKKARFAAGTDQQKLTATDDVLTALKSFELRQTVMDAGRPPWTGKTARDATAAKAELDIISIPKAQRQLTPQGGGVNPSYWIERSSNTGQPQRSFLCKPPSPSATPGIPQGGEVAREALSGRAAEMLGQTVKLDLEMPETHVVQVPTGYFPTAVQGAAFGAVPCSVQEAKNVRGDFRHTPQTDLDQVPASQCASLALLDMVTLNTDRHVENLLIGQDGRLVPIDHGVTFPADNQPGKARIAEAMSGPHNALLRLPGTHQPMTDEMAAGLRAIDPAAMRGQMAQQRAEIDQENPTIAGKLSDGALDMTLYATRFLMLSGEIESGKKPNKIRLSPASVQVAFGIHSAELLLLPVPTDNRAAKPFDKKAREFLKQALADQKLTAQVCLLEDTAFLAMREALAALRWTVNSRVAGPASGIHSDPVLCAKLLAARLKCPQNVSPGKELTTAREMLRSAKIKPDQIQAALVNMQIAALRTMAPYLPAQRQNGLLSMINNNIDQLRADPKLRRDLMLSVQSQIADAQAAELRGLKTQYIIPDDLRHLAYFAEAQARNDFADGRTQLDDIAQMAAAGQRNIRPVHPPGGAAPPPPQAAPPPPQNAPPGGGGQPAQQNPPGVGNG